MLVCLSVDKWTEAFIWYKYHTYILRKEIHFYRLTRLLAGSCEVLSSLIVRRRRP